MPLNLIYLKRTMSAQFTRDNNILIRDYDCNGSNFECTSYIERYDNVKYLGIVIDEDINWKYHVNYVNYKIRETVYKFQQPVNFLPLLPLKSLLLSSLEL